VENYKIYCGDCERVLEKDIKKNSIDLCITSPPYNLNLGHNKYNKTPYDLYNDNKNHWEYITWLKKIFKKVYKVLRPGGRCVINIGDTKNGKIPLNSDIIQFMTKDLNYLIMTTIIWDKEHTNSITSWGSYCSPSSPSFPKPFEYILIFAKETRKLQYKGETDLTPDEFKKWAYGLWKFPGEQKLKKIGHPAVFPVELPYRLIKILSWKNSTILDPFCGSGTTGIASTILNRKFVGIEISKKYCEISKKRIESAIPIDIFKEN